jgi:hypothetical protein
MIAPQFGAAALAAIRPGTKAMSTYKGLFANFYDDDGNFTWEIVDQRRREKDFERRVSDELTFNPTFCVPSDPQVKH